MQVWRDDDDAGVWLIDWEITWNEWGDGWVRQARNTSVRFVFFWDRVEAMDGWMD